MRALFLHSCVVLLVACAGSTSSSNQSGAGLDDRGLDEWIVALEDPGESRRAAVALRGFVAEEGGERAIEPLLAAWERDGHMPEALDTAIALAADGRGGPYWERVLPTLRTALSDATVSDARSLESALLAVDAITRVGDEASVPALVATARRSVPDLAPGHRLRLAAIAALGAFPDSDEGFAALTSLLAIEPSHRVQVIPSAAALALGTSRRADAVVPILEALIRMPKLFPAARRALALIGAPAVPELVALLEDRQQRLDEVARDLELNVDCAREMGLGTRCPAPGLLRYRAAFLLADLNARQATDALVRALERPAWPVYFDGSDPGPDDHVVILGALGRIGDASAADAVWTYAQNSTNKDENRAAAIEAYATLSSDASALPVLARMLTDEASGAALREAAARGYARMVRDPAAMRPLLDLAAGSAAGLEAHLARAQVGASCGSDASCYLEILDEEREGLLAELAARVPGLAADADGGDDGLADAARGRALLELGKLGNGASSALERVIEESARSRTERLHRHALAAIVRIAPRPCDACVRGLGRIIETERAGSGRSWVLIETEIVHSYFTWAGRMPGSK